MFIVEVLDGTRYISTKWADLFSPYNANQILKLDPATNQTSLVGSIYSGGSNMGGVLAPNGMIYFASVLLIKYLN
jgi:hypothetical protein